jgi:hypothetical protein
MIFHELSIKIGRFWIIEAIYFIIPVPKIKYSYDHFHAKDKNKCD